MNFTQLMAFKAIAENGSITKAAQLLRVSQPSVSKHLKHLEEDYGVKLFERSAEVTGLTDSGRILLRHVNIILAQLEELKQKLKPANTLTRPESLKIAGSYAASALLLPSVLAIFKRKHGDRPIILRTGTTRDAKSLLLNGTVEIALINENPTDPDLESEQFRQETLVVFAAPNHPLARKKRVTQSDLNAATLVTPGKASTVDKFFKQMVHEGIRAKIAIRCGTPESVKTMVKKGIGVGILFKDLVTPDIEKKVFKIVAIRGLKLAVQSYIVYYKHRSLSPSAREFLDLLRRKAHIGS